MNGDFGGTDNRLFQEGDDALFRPFPRLTHHEARRAGMLLKIAMDDFQTEPRFATASRTGQEEDKAVVMEGTILPGGGVEKGLNLIVREEVVEPRVLLRCPQVPVFR